MILKNPLIISNLSVFIIILFDLLSGKKSFYFKKKSFSQLKTDFFYTILIKTGYLIYVAAIFSLGLPYFIGRLIRYFISYFKNIFSFDLTYLFQSDEASIISKILISIFFIILLDLLNYLQHFLLHKNKWLWEIHKIHHSAETMNVLNTYREHPLDKAINYIPTSICIGIFAYPINSIDNLFWIYLLALYNAIGPLKHSNIISDWGFFGKYIIQSPLHHRAHHSNLKEYYDSNYANSFQIWDHIFGTYVEPGNKINLATPLGIPKENKKVSLNGYSSFLKTLFFPYISWLPKKIFKSY